MITGDHGDSCDTGPSTVGANDTCVVTVASNLPLQVRACVCVPVSVHFDVYC